jgi:SAM-dependent methyltransferase
MDHLEAGALWEANAEVWTLLARKGCDVYRDLLNTPAFFANLPPVQGLKGIDIGCGEGANTRLLSVRGAIMSAIDIAPTFIRHAQSFPGPSIEYFVASAHNLPFPNESFDFATAFMSLMDVPDPALAIQEAHRVLRPGGFLQFNIIHPCFNTPRRKLLRDVEGIAYAVEVGDYYKNIDGRLDRWIFGKTPIELRPGLRPFEVPLFHRTLSYWVGSILASGFQLEWLGEPHASDETVAAEPALQDTQVVSYFLHVRCRKPRA